MSTLRSFWRIVAGRDDRETRPAPAPATEADQSAATRTLEVAPNDPIVAYFQSAPGVVEMDKLQLNSPAAQALREAGVRMAVPLVSHGELVGLLNLGPRLSEQEYSTDDRRLLDNLATQAAPALRVAQLAQQQQVEARERERLEQELRVARLIQQTLLPKEVPQMPGWDVAAHYQPARAVGGDFYDFLYFLDGRVGLVVGDVTDKGVPAALVMATTRSVLRAAVERLESPGAVLERVNNLLHPDIPAKMFVTCLYALLDPASGRMVFANAGHNLPYRKGARGVEELRATGMPLGLMTDMIYEEKQITLEAGDSVLFYSDGLVEAHDPGRAMFGNPRLHQLLADHAQPTGAAWIDFLLADLAAFTGADWEQEDDVTLMTLEYLTPPPPLSEAERGTGGEVFQTLAEFTLPSERGNERTAMKRVAETVKDLNLPGPRMERLKTAVAETTMNAMEYGNKFQAELPVDIQVLASPTVLRVRVTDRGDGPLTIEPEIPDLEAKLAGLQKPRGWGLFLISKMVDEMRASNSGDSYTVELLWHLEGGNSGSSNV